MALEIIVIYVTKVKVKLFVLIKIKPNVL